MSETTTTKPAQRELGIIPVRVPVQLLIDILTTAIEGGTNYWLLGTTAEFTDEGGYRMVGILDNETGKPFDASNFREGYDPSVREVNIDTVAQGMKVILAGSNPDFVGKMAQRLAGGILSAAHGGDFDFDANDADVIVQLGLFGQVVFG